MTAPRRQRCGRTRPGDGQRTVAASTRSRLNSGRYYARGAVAPNAWHSGAPAPCRPPALLRPAGAAGRHSARPAGQRPAPRRACAARPDDLWSAAARRWTTPRDGRPVQPADRLGDGRTASTGLVDGLTITAGVRSTSAASALRAGSRGCTASRRRWRSRGLALAAAGAGDADRRAPHPEAAARTATASRLKVTKASAVEVMTMRAMRPLSAW